MTIYGDGPAAVALWYDGHGRHVDTYGSEEDAAGYALYKLDDGEGDWRRLLGAQFPDGRTVDLVDYPERGVWPAFDEVQDEAERRRAERLAQDAMPKPPPPPMRGVRDPFGVKTVMVEMDAPDWLGKPLGPPA